ncbi:MAG: hypothetical protein JOY82_09880 [Streptosporangiaceae bacterium]|nr:hypothetical protein [Streptosporangiaceae bacterium]MBV9854819.1 hypothetical protein [Streptosporangiaceae bacterium]
MTTTPLDAFGRREVPGATLPDAARRETGLPDVAEAVRDFNESNQAHEDTWTRAHQAADMVRRGTGEERLAQQDAREAREFHLAVQAEHPHRRASLLRQAIVAALTVGLDAVACWFAAQALGNGQLETLFWAGLFLAILASGEIALDYYSDRNRKAWRLLVLGLVLFVAGLGVLRFLYLATVGTNGAAAALVGATLFTAATSGFVLIGYRALRAAEKFPAWQARRRARQAAREAAAAGARLAGYVAERDRLVDAYVSRIRVFFLKTSTSSQLALMEAAVRAHLSGRDALCGRRFPHGISSGGRM